MTFALAAALVAAIALPHVAPLDRAPPAIAVLVWLSALIVRALTALLAALAAFVVLPRTQVFDLVTHWCWYTALPLLTTHLGLDGHQVGDAALLLPGAALAASVVSVAFGVWRATRAVGRLVRRAIGTGPRDSVILGDGEVVVAAAGLRRPRVIVSAGALTSFDDDELAASLEHEHGHIVHRHRYVLVTAEACRALARFLPGTRRASRELMVHLERDADRFALCRKHEPLVLASAICKAVQGGLPVTSSGLGGGGVARRLRELLDGGTATPPRAATGARAVAAVMVTAAVALIAALPSATAAAVQHGDRAAITAPHCTA